MERTGNDPGRGAPEEGGGLSADDEDMALGQAAQAVWGDGDDVGTPLPPPAPADPILPPNGVAPY